MYRKTRKQRKQCGGETVPVKQIMLNTPMRNALQRYNRTTRFRNFKSNANRVKSEGFYPIIPRFNTPGKLSRMEGNNSMSGIGILKPTSEEFNRILENKPVKLKATAAITKPNGTKTTLY